MDSRTSASIDGAAHSRWADAMPDLDYRAEIHNLVVRFYREIAFDDRLGPVVSEVVTMRTDIRMIN